MSCSRMSALRLTLQFSHAQLSMETRDEPGRKAMRGIGFNLAMPS